MKKIYLTSFFLIATYFSNAQDKRSISNGIPTFKTDEEKAEWIKKNPEEYKKMGGTIKSSTPEFKNQAEKNAWLEGQKPKKEEMKKNLNIEATISTEAEKDAYMRNREDIIYISQSEFDALPANKKESVLSDRKFKIIK